MVQGERAGRVGRSGGGAPGRAPAGALLLFLGGAAAALSATVVAEPGARAEGAARGVGGYRYRVTLAGVAEGRTRLDVEWSRLAPDGSVARASGGGAKERLCAMMVGAARAMHEVRAGDGRGLPLRPASDDADCFVAGVPAGAPLTVRYWFDLQGMDGRWYDPDYATTVAGGWLMGDKAVLLRPEEVPDPALPVELEVRVPEGLRASLPFEPLGAGPDGASRYRLDTDELDCGSYLAMGRLRTLAEVPVRGGVMAPVLLDGEHRAGDEVLRGWVGQAAGAVADFYLGLPRPRVLVFLVPVPRSSDGGVFGAVMRHARTPTAVLLFGAEAREPAAFADDWVAVHELFHLGNPEVEGKLPWFVEGFTTYYQDVLRGRWQPDGGLAMWGDLHDGFRRHCDAETGGTGPLAEESRTMRRTHRYTRVYWGGACLAFQVDVAIRRRSGGREGLDGVLRAMLAEGRRRPFTEEAVVARLDGAAGAPVVATGLVRRDRAPLGELYRQLGIEPTGPETVRLRDDAPLAPLRRAIFAGAGAGAAAPPAAPGPR